MKNINAFAHVTMLFYIAAILVSAGAVYSINYAYNPPQPFVHLTYNSIAQAGEGYVNDTLPYPIEITSIYCTQPNGEKLEFSDSSNNIVQPGSNTYIVVGVSSTITKLPLNCTDWKVAYLNAQGIPSVTPNGVQVHQSG